MTTIRILRNRISGRRTERAQGMIEYGLVIGLIATWVVAIFIALKPLFTERLAVGKVEKYAGQGRVELAAAVGVSISYTVGGDGSVTADDF